MLSLTRSGRPGSQQEKKIAAAVAAAAVRWLTGFSPSEPTERTPRETSLFLSKKFYTQVRGQVSLGPNYFLPAPTLDKLHFSTKTTRNDQANQGSHRVRVHDRGYIHGRACESRPKSRVPHSSSEILREMLQALRPRHYGRRHALYERQIKPLIRRPGL